ncbi:MAG TPA: tetratricopeptide repeat protein, partial [Elainellaceae cyanobacterium]
LVAALAADLQVRAKGKGLFITLCTVILMGGIFIVSPHPSLSLPVPPELSPPAQESLMLGFLEEHPYKLQHLIEDVVQESSAIENTFQSKLDQKFGLTLDLLKVLSAELIIILPAMIGLLALLFYRNGKKIADEATHQLHDEEQRVEQKLTDLQDQSSKLKRDLEQLQIQLFHHSSDYPSSLTLEVLENQRVIQNFSRFSAPRPALESGSSRESKSLSSGLEQNSVATSCPIKITTGTLADDSATSVQDLITSNELAVWSSQQVSTQEESAEYLDHPSGIEAEPEAKLLGSCDPNTLTKDETSDFDDSHDFDDSQRLANNDPVEAHDLNLMPDDIPSELVKADMLTGHEETVEAYMKRGNASFLRYQYQEAISWYERAIAISSEHYLAWFGKGFALAQLHHYPQALDAYDRVIQSKEDYHLAWYNRGKVLEELQQFGEALASYNRALELKPNCLDAPL